MKEEEFKSYFAIIRTATNKPVLSQLICCQNCKNRFFFPNHIGLIKSLECCPFCGVDSLNLYFDDTLEIANMYEGSIPSISTFCSRCTGPIGLLEDPTVIKDLQFCPYCKQKFEEIEVIDI